MEEIELADQVGLDVFGVGEHHRPDFVVSSPAVILGAAAVRTERIRLSSAVTVLSSDDPVRVFQDFATVDLLSGGRAEIMAGRGSFIESFPLFGYDLDDYDELFAEKLELLLELRESETVTWSGRHRAALDDVGRLPAPGPGAAADLARGGRHAESIVRAASLGLPLALAIIGGSPERFVPLVELYRQAARRSRPPGPAGRHQLAHVRGGHVTAGGRRVLPRLCRDDEPDRARARLAADDARAVRPAALAARSARGRQPAGGRREDPLPARAVRPPALPGTDQRRPPPHAKAMRAIELLGHRGRAGRQGELERRSSAPSAASG